MAPTAPSRATRGRSPRVPPAITRGSESMPALHVVEEIPGDLGVLLWRSVRNVALWARTPAEHRAALFDPAAAANRAGDAARVSPEPELVAPLSVIISLLETPGRVDLPRLVHACRRVAAWAEGRGALGTALEFAQAAALAQPDAAVLAFDVGRLARRRAEYDRAESWYTRAIIQGRQTSDWRSYAMAFAGIGNLFLQRGNYPLARKSYYRCLRAASRHSMHDLAGAAYHNLFTAAVETRSGAEAEVFAEQAFQALGPTSPAVPRLAFDVAYYWTDQGRFSEALRVGSALLVHFDAPTERLLVLGLVARAAGGSGNADLFVRTWDEVGALLAGDVASDSAARAWLFLANGALDLEEWDRAGEAAQRALAFATQRGEGRLIIAAEEAEASARTRRHSSAARVDIQPGATLADTFVSALRRVHGPPVAV